MLTLTSIQWLEILYNNYETRILDFDGWRTRDEFENLEITAQDFINRLWICTCSWKRNENINPIDLEMLGEEYINFE